MILHNNKQTKITVETSKLHQNVVKLQEKKKKNYSEYINHIQQNLKSNQKYFVGNKYSCKYELETFVLLFHTEIMGFSFVQLFAFK